MSGQCISEAHVKHRGTSSTSKETFSFSGDFDTGIWPSGRIPQDSEISTQRQKDGSSNRLSALRVSSAFRMVSDDAVCIIACLMSIKILAVERKQLYEQRSILGEQEELKKIMRQDSLQRWQEKWDASEQGRSHRLIPQVDN